MENMATPFTRFEIEARMTERIRWVKENGLDFAQNPREFGVYCSVLASQLRPVKYLELGAREGGSLYVAAGFLAEGSTLIAVDLPGAAWGWEGSGDGLEMAANALREEGYQVHIVIGDTNDALTFNRVSAILGAAGADVLFLDADHTFVGVRADWSRYGPLTKRPGLVGFHDIAERPDTPKVEVHKHWKQMRSRYKSLEVIYQYGIGIAWLEK